MRRTIVLFALILTVAACSGDGSDDSTTTSAEGTVTTAPPEPTTTAAPPEPTTTQSESTTTQAAAGEAIGVADTSLGQILVDASGHTLYIFTADVGATSTCYDACEATWPVVSADVEAGEGVTATLGETTRDDDSAQLTVNGRPVYVYSADEAPGDVNGQGLAGAWFVMAPDGEPMDE